jgi:transcriptional regulator with XRE-family HTH domain
LQRRSRAYREADGLSQEAFADVLGVHRTYMGGIERGERNLTLRSVERIAERLGVDPPLHKRPALSRMRNIRFAPPFSTALSVRTGL